MTAQLYCARADLYDHGIPRGSLTNPARLASNSGTADPASDSFALDAHGFDTGYELQFRAEGNGSLPAPLVALTTYYAIALDDNRFQVSATAGGPAIDLTTAGGRVLVIAKIPFDAAIEWASRIIDDALPAHAVPLPSPIPPIVRMTCAELAAGKLTGRGGQTSKSLSEIVDAARKRLETWARGVPIRGADAPTTHTLLATSAAAACVDPNGWNRFGGL